MIKFKKGDRVRGRVTGKTGTFVDYYRRIDGSKSSRVHIVRWDGDHNHSIAVRIEIETEPTLGS